MTLAKRLRSERMRLRLSQAELAVLGGVQANAQGLYEKGSRIPRADYLGCLAALGMDVLFIITGVRRPSMMEQLSGDESEFIQAWRSLPTEDRLAFEQILTTLARPVAVELISV